MENDVQLMCTRAKEIFFLLKKKRENRLKNGLAKEVKGPTFMFMAKVTGS